MATSTVPMHAVSGTHHIYVYVGSPPKRQTLIVDTGSRIMAFPCDPCKNCGHHTSPNYYSPLESTTDVQLPCDRCHYDMSVRHFTIHAYRYFRSFQSCHSSFIIFLFCHTYFLCLFWGRLYMFVEMCGGEVCFKSGLCRGFFVEWI
jgi:hypothetical protein